MSRSQIWGSPRRPGRRRRLCRAAAGGLGATPRPVVSSCLSGGRQFSGLSLAWGPRLWEFPPRGHCGTIWVSWAGLGALFVWCVGYCLVTGLCGSRCPPPPQVVLSWRADAAGVMGAGGCEAAQLSCHTIKGCMLWRTYGDMDGACALHACRRGGEGGDRRAIAFVGTCTGQGGAGAPVVVHYQG